MINRQNADLLYQVVRSKTLNKKRPVASSKDRSEVSGGGRKPWPQKGTGRARHGSIRSPLFRGGGVTFGPRKERNYKKRIPRTISQKSFAIVWENKRSEHEVKEVLTPTLKEYKTKYLAAWIKDIMGNATALLVVSTNVEMLKRAGRNIPKLLIRDPNNFDALDILSHKYVIISKDALPAIQRRLAVAVKEKKEIVAEVKKESLQKKEE